ncbi:MAG: flagellar basal body-associated FliL family protein [Pseudomonadota bacterium]|jgi:flagellar protein FliL
MAKAPAKNIPDPDTEEEGAAAEGAETPEPAKKKFSGKVIVLYIALPLLVLLGGAGAGAYFLGFFGGEAGEHADAGPAAAEPEKTVFYEVPEILVNLNSTGKKETYLKIRISLELENPETQAAIEPMMPRVIDSFQVFLREMRVEDLSGSAGMVRLKEELLNRINLSIQPYKVIDVLFKEMLIQ